MGRVKIMTRNIVGTKNHRMIINNDIYLVNMTIIL